MLTLDFVRASYKFEWCAEYGENRHTSRKANIPRTCVVIVDLGESAVLHKPHANIAHAILLNWGNIYDGYVRHSWLGKCMVL